MGKEILGGPAAWHEAGNSGGVARVQEASRGRPRASGQCVERPRRCPEAARLAAGQRTAVARQNNGEGGRLYFEPREEEEGEIGMVLQFPKCLGG